VTSLISKSSRGNFYIVPAKDKQINGKYIIGIRIKVPKFLYKDRVIEYKDYFKVFITSKLISFYITLSDIFRTTRNE